MKRPSCSQRELFEATCCLMCSCWSFFLSFFKNNRTKKIYFDLGFEDSGSDWRFRHALLLFLRHSLVFFSSEGNLSHTQNHRIRPDKSYTPQVLENIRTLQYILIADSLPPPSIPERRSPHSRWQTHFWGSLRGVVLPLQAYFAAFYSISGTL